MGECLPSESHPMAAFNPNSKTITWERLETMRLQKLGLPNRYSRHFNVLRTSQQSQGMATEQQDSCGTLASESPSPAPVSARVEKGQVSGISNSLAPFATLGKPTCGYFFSRVTDNRKRKFGIPASDLVKWRCSTGHQPR